jgi:hypothetical protein
MVKYFVVFSFVLVCLFNTNLYAGDDYNSEDPLYPTEIAPHAKESAESFQKRKAVFDAQKDSGLINVQRIAEQDRITRQLEGLDSKREMQNNDNMKTAD